MKTAPYAIAGSIAAGALLLLAGCGQKRNEVAQGPQGAIAPAVQVSPTDTKTILAAGPSAVITSAKCPGTKNPNKVKLVIRENFLRKLGSDRTIERDVEVEDGNGVSSPQATPPDIGASQYQPTYLDMGVPASGGTGTWTPIVIRLKSNAADPIRFMPVRVAGIDNPIDSSYAVLAPAGAASKFCGRQSFDPQDPGVVRFGAVLAPGEVVSINIGLLIPDKANPGFYIPIYLDPNIKNVG